MGRMVITFVVGLFMLLLSLSSAVAVQLKMELDDVIKISDHVVHGKVVTIESRWVEDERGRHIRTYGKVSVISHLKGGNGPEIDAEFDGGTVGDITEAVSDTVTVTPGEEAVFFLNKEKKTGIHRPAAGGYSKYRVIKGKAYGLSGHTTVEEIRAKLTHPGGAALTVEPQSGTADSTNIYDNAETGTYSPPGTGIEVTDFGTTTGGHIVKFTFAYVTTLANPGTVTVKFYSGTTSATKGALLKTFTYSGLMGSNDGGARGFAQTIVLAPADHFDLPSGAFGYSMTFDNSSTGVWLASGGTGNIDGFWIGSSYFPSPWGGSPFGSFYLKAEKADASGPDITGISPASASAGTDTTVTITGTGFGATQGAGTVNFFYKDGSSTIPGVVTAWSDTSITCKVPVGTVDGYSGSAASGPVTVTTNGAATSDGYPFIVTFGYGQKKWSGSTVNYRINENTADCTGEGAAVETAAATWNGAGANFSFSYAGTHANTTSSSNTANEVLWGTVSSPGIIAQATYWFIGSQIVETDIVFNDVNFLWSTNASPTGDQMDVQTITLHELGHWLNLRDLYGSSGITGNDNNKVMYGFAGNGLLKRVLTTADSDGIRWIYPATPQPPTVTTGAATSITTTGAALNGTVNANNASTTVTFEYGTTASYGSTITAVESPVTGSAGTSVSTAITGLLPGTLYHYRAKGVSTGGTTNGSDQTFTTNTTVCAAIPDGSFEGGTPSASWAETSTNFGTPLCSLATCGNGGGATGPLTGSWWAWFGGTSEPETSSLTQNVAIPVDSTPRLKFYLWNGTSSGNGADFLKVTVDGDQIFSMVTGNPLYTGGYALVELDITPYADGATHVISFQSTTTGPVGTNITVDDVAIDCSASPCNNGIIRIGPTDYPSVQAAMNDAGGGSAIMASAHIFTESPIFSQSGTVTLEGGYDCGLTQNSGYTAIDGTLTIEGTGTLIIENLNIR